MQFVELSDNKIINLDQVAWINFKGPCEGEDDPTRGCLIFGGGGEAERIELEPEDVQILKNLRSFNGYAYTIGEYIINFQNVSNIKIETPNKVAIFFTNQVSPLGVLRLSKGEAREFLKNDKYRAILNMPQVVSRQGA